MLSDERLRRAVELQNRVRAKMLKPPPEHWIWTMKPEVIASFRCGMEPIADWSGPRVRDDFWLQYLDEADVRAWAAFILEALPEAVASLEAAHEEKR